MKPLAVLTVAAALVGCSASETQTEQSGLSAVTKVDVTAKTLKGVPAGTRYVLDFATGGTIYSLDPGAGRLDFDRMLVRTDEGQEACLPWVNENVPTELRYNPQTDILTVGLLEDFRAYWPPPPVRTAPAFTCEGNYCDCSGAVDCVDMIFSPECRGSFFECTARSGVLRCLCDRRP